MNPASRSFFAAAHSLDGAEGLRLRDHRRRAALVLGLQQDVGVAVDQAGQHRIGREVDHARAGRNRRIRPDPFDAVAG